uniref:Putative secreted protein n=1 Tax=Anopheles marajoara TaxID=58244 RepID=A0A2M4C6V9_9DIPT
MVSLLLFFAVHSTVSLSILSSVRRGRPVSMAAVYRVSFVPFVRWQERRMQNRSWRSQTAILPEPRWNDEMPPEISQHAPQLSLQLGGLCRGHDAARPVVVVSGRLSLCLSSSKREVKTHRCGGVGGGIGEY